LFDGRWPLRSSTLLGLLFPLLRRFSS